MKKSVLKRGTAMLAVMTMVPVVTSIHAYAATTFDSQYQANASQEASLLQTAQSSSFSDAYTVALSSAVQSINEQVTALYNAEQTLAAKQSSTSQLDQQSLQDQLQKLEQQRQALQKQVQQARDNLSSLFPGHGKGREKGDGPGHSDFGHAHQYLNQLDKQLRDVTRKIDQLKHSSDDDSPSSYNDGLKALQTSILQLQQTAIRYTKEWIAEEQNHGTTNPGTLSAPTLTVTNQYYLGFITASGVTPQAQVVLYNDSTGQQVASTTAGSSGIVVFNNVSPGQYYAVQMLNGVASNHSNVVIVQGNLSTPKLSVTQSGGFNQVNVSGGTSGATAHLYAVGGSEIRSATINSSGDASFSQIPAGVYFVVDTLNGAQSAASNQVTVMSELATPTISRTTVNGHYAISVTGGVPYATVHLYNNVNSTLVGTISLNAQGQAVFQNVGNGSYYVQEEYGGTGSRQSNIVFVY